MQASMGMAHAGGYWGGGMGVTVLRPGPDGNENQQCDLSPRLAPVSHRGCTGILMRQPTTSSLTRGLPVFCIQSAWQSDKRTIWKAG
jgi:hypothetical protein